MKPKSKTITSIGKKTPPVAKPANATRGANASTMALKKATDKGCEKHTQVKPAKAPAKAAKPAAEAKTKAKPVAVPEVKKTPSKPATPPKPVKAETAKPAKAPAKKKADAKVITSPIANALGRIRRNVVAAVTSNKPSEDKTVQAFPNKTAEDPAPVKPQLDDSRAFLPPASVRRPAPQVKKPVVAQQGRVAVSDLLKASSAPAQDTSSPVFDIMKHIKG